MGDQHHSVQVFSFTTRLSKAKLKNYHKASFRGMAASSHAKKSPDHDDHDFPASDSVAMEPATKKPRLKLNGPRRQSDESGDTITVSQPKRLADQNIRFKYSGNMNISPDDLSQTAPVAKANSPQPSASPAPSSGLSSLSSAPPSEKETSPFVDPEPSSRRDYGDFMSYYIVGGDDDPEPIAKPKAVPKQAAKSAAKTASKPKGMPKQKVSKSQASKPPTLATQPPVPNPPQQIQPQHSHQPLAHAPQQGHGPPPRQHNAPAPHQLPQGTLRPQHAAPPYPQGLPQNRPAMQGHPHQRPAPVPQPIVQFSDIVHQPPPSHPDTVATMIQKLGELSLALQTFGGAPLPPPASPSPSPEPAVRATSSGNDDNPLDSFLSFFDGDDDVDPLDRQLANPGTPDGPLTHGIVFIQNALKSWAQQRVSQMYTQQYHQQIQAQQQANQKRGPGRPRKFDEPTHMLPPSPVIQMDLASTPEGNAIKAFQAVLYSECLRVNVRLPAKLASALRKLYMQIDLLINQGEREPKADWQCMSYQAQISAQQTRVDRWKDHQAKVLEETQRQQSLANQNIMAQMGLPPQHYAMTAAQAELQHAIELETRRAQAHAHQQPYIRQQHLNPLQLGAHSSGPPGGCVPSQPPNNSMRPSSAGPLSGKSDAVAQLMPQNGTPTTQTSSSPGVQLDKMKLYVPGYLPRSGNQMKFSFSPQNETAVQAFGANAFPGTQSPSSTLPNRSPMSAPPSHISPQQPSVDLTAASAMGERPATAPLDPDAMEVDKVAPQPSARPPTEARQPIVQSLTPVESTEPATNGNFRAHQRPHTPVITHGFTAVNAPPPRVESIPDWSPSDTSPETIRVASKKPNGRAMASASPRSSNKRSASEMNGHVENTTMPSKFPHPGAIVLDQ